MRSYKRKEECGNCGTLAPVVRRDYEFQEMGIPVILERAEVVECPECHQISPIIENMNDLMHTLALAVICSPCKLAGDEIRFLRQYADKSAVEFAKLLHVDNTHLSKLENGRTEVGPQTDKYIRMVVLSMSPELKDKMGELLEMLPEIKDSCIEHKPAIKIDPQDLLQHA